MARKPVIYGIAAAGLVSVIALAVFVALPGGLSESSAPGEAKTQEILGASTMPALNLYSGDIDPSTSQRITPAERSLDIPGSSGVPAFRYVADADGSEEVITLKADGSTPRRSRRLLPLAAWKAGYASVVGADLFCHHGSGD